jgi:hypothetical protein
MTLARLVSAAMLLALPACGGAGEPDECRTFEDCDRLLATAEIDDRPLSVAVDASDINGVTGLGDGFATVSMIAFSPWVGGGEGMQFWLDGFRGVGAYPVVECCWEIGAANAVYWRGNPTDNGPSYWGMGAPGDTVWVAAYDSLSGAIEGSFHFTGEGVGPAVTVANGRFRGVVRPYSGAASTRWGASP